jgi:uncharacterized protein YdeI (YjbR/CyaY-like superfamily)
VFFESRSALRAWLARHHAAHPAIWLVYEKKSAGGSRALGYDAIVEEALCFGWIDSVSRGLDDRRSMLYFSPRRRGSVWSALNKRRIESLERDGLMTEAGRALVEGAKRDGSWVALDEAEALIVPEDLALALASNPRARERFEAFPPGVRKRALTLIAAAKRGEARRQRIATIVADAARNVRPGEAPAKGRRAIRKSKAARG